MSTILYIDDDEHYAIMIKTLLEMHGFIVETAYDGLEGLRKARETRPDLILLDMYLPRIDGLEVVEQLQGEAMTGDIPIVIISALPKHSSYRLLDGTGIRDVISKPFRIEELLRVLTKHLPQCTGRMIPAPTVC